ncbi:hypothetical protein HYX06_06520 [Candidatus Woesearchaeota archaeon]|nr:hypothetical protein [Candidatus Woesearchaeota archaeon]
MVQQTQQGPKFTLPSLERGVTFWIDCQTDKEGIIVKVNVAPDRQLESVSETVRDAVNHHFKRIGYTGTIEYSPNPVN